MRFFLFWKQETEFWIHRVYLKRRYYWVNFNSIPGPGIKLSKLKIGSYALIIVSIIIRISSDSFFLFWVLIELNFIRFISILYFDEQLSLVFKVFIPQALFSICILISVLIKHSLYTRAYLWDLLRILSVFGKLGLFPFIFWIIRVLGEIRFPGLYIFGTFQKVLPIVLLGELNSNYNLLIGLTVATLFILICFLLITRGFSGILPCLVIFRTCWGAMSIIMVTMFINYLLVFRVAFGGYLFIVTRVVVNEEKWGGMGLHSLGRDKGLGLLLIIAVLGWPPYALFFVKISILSFVATSYRVIITGIIFGSSVLVIVRFFLCHLSFLNLRTRHCVRRLPFQGRRIRLFRRFLFFLVRAFFLVT